MKLKQNSFDLFQFYFNCAGSLKLIRKSYPPLFHPIFS